MDFKIPHNLELEKNLLAALLRDGRLVELALAAGVTENTFYEAFGRKIFLTMLELYRSGEGIDLVTVGGRMIDDVAALAELEGTLVTMVNIQHWIDGLRRLEAARNIRITALELLQQVGNGLTCDFPAVYSGMEAALMSAGQIGRRETARTLAKIAEDAEELEARGVEGQIPYFPAATEGAQELHHHRREIHVLAAAPGCGKTAFAVGVLKQQLRAGLRSVYFCSESSSEAIQNRLAAQICGIPHFITQRTGEDPVKLAMFRETRRQLAAFEDRLFIRGMETGMNSADAIRTELRRIVTKIGGIDFFVVDFLQFLQPPRHLITRSKLEQVDYSVSLLHETAGELNAAGLILSQLNREGQKGDALPGLSHLRDCGTIEQLAHTVSFLHRRPDDQQTKFYSRKTRNQEPFAMWLGWDGVGYVSSALYDSGDIPRHLEVES